MHELLLFGRIPPSQHPHLLHILSGISAMQPIPLLEKHRIFTPTRSTTDTPAKTQGGAAKDEYAQKSLQAAAKGDLFVVQLVADVLAVAAGSGGAGEREEGAMEGVEVAGGDGEGETHGEGRVREAVREQWTLQFRDIPEVARQRPVTTRLMADVPVAAGDAMAFMRALGYLHTSTYLLQGHRFTYQNTSLLLYRVFVPTTASDVTTTKTNPEQYNNNVSDNAGLIDMAQQRLLDASGTWVLQAGLRVQDGSKVETMAQGVNELVGVREMLRGVVELEIGERLAMDTRVK
ncbi:Mediator of RNA polymerase II transcription subunit 18 [Puttea exsequens]|nr:Mediator of RNA polymerase II transcription subunit 18 [Puttea exsequens]